jgi:hypothetical protein
MERNVLEKLVADLCSEMLKKFEDNKVEFL